MTSFLKQALELVENPALAELRTVRSGGTVLSDEEAIALLGRAGLTDVHAVPGDWPLPVRFVAGRGLAARGV